MPVNQAHSGNVDASFAQMAEQVASYLVIAKAADEPCLMPQRSNCNARRSGRLPMQ